MAESSVDRVRKAIVARAYRLTAHAEYEREADSISTDEIEEAFGSEGLEQVEEYPRDPREDPARFS